MASAFLLITVAAALLARRTRSEQDGPVDLATADRNAMPSLPARGDFGLEVGVPEALHWGEAPEPETTDEAPKRPAHAEIGGLATADLLVIAGSARDEWLRAESIEELAARRADEASPLMIALLRDREAGVRRAAAEGLAELQDEGALSALRNALQGETDAAAKAALEEAVAEFRAR